MPDVLIRGLDPGILQALKSSAAASGRSLQAEIHQVLTIATLKNLAATRRLSARWLKQLGEGRQSDSAALIREDRGAR
jgi:plasmid stability protein